MFLNFRRIVWAVIAIFFLISTTYGLDLTYITHSPNVDMEEAVAELRVQANEGVAEAQFDLGLHYVNGDGVKKDLDQGFIWLMKAADQNLPVAQVTTAVFYTEVEKNNAMALTYLKKAADQDFLDAQLILASLYASDNEYKNAVVGGQDYEAARFWLRKASDQGSSDAMNQMAETYRLENYWNPDYPNIVKWLQKAVDAGSGEAAYKLAQMYLDGDLGKRDSAKATELYKKAALKGHDESINHLVRNAENNDVETQQFLAALYNDYGHDTPVFKEYRQNHQQTSPANSPESTALLDQGNTLYYFKIDSEGSYSYYKKSADMGNALAKAQLAKMMYLGAGMPQDKATAKRWFSEVKDSLEILAQSGNPFAQYLWGYYYEAGFNGTPSASSAFVWYEKSAEQGYATAQNNLGGMYSKGEFVSQDYAQAIHWYTKAAEQGAAISQSNLAEHYYLGKGVPRDYDQALSWYYRAAEQGWGYAAKMIGIMCENGEGCADQAKWYGADGFMEDFKDKDLGVALIWYHTAIKLGDTSAQERIDTLMGTYPSCQTSGYNTGVRLMQIGGAITDPIEWAIEKGCNSDNLYAIEFRLDGLANREYIEDGKHELLLEFARKYWSRFWEICPANSPWIEEAEEKRDSVRRYVYEAYQLLPEANACAAKLQQAHERISKAND